MLIPLDTPVAPLVANVGGKAASLIRLAQRGFNVPAGVVVPRAFFDAWFEAVGDLGAWRAAIELVSSDKNLNATSQARLVTLCDEAKAAARQLPLTVNQRDALVALRRLGGEVFAVRSSSPEEDLANASFAGLYETVLDMTPDDIERSVRTCFTSALDSRVLIYKRERGIEDWAPKIAVIVQQQVASSTSGVGFSINPLTNDFDEVLINAVPGLGEALVSGDLTPDSIVVDAHKNRIVESRPSGDRTSGELCLSADHVERLTQEIKRIEAAEGVPIDVEWTFRDDELFILQARPITTYIPIPRELLTAPGEQRHLWFDTYHNDGITMSQPVSPAGGEMVFAMVRLITSWIMKTDIDRQQFARYGLVFAGGRMYGDLSLLLHLMGSGKAIARQAEAMEPTMAAVFTSAKLDQFRLAEIPKHLARRRVYWALLRMLWYTRQAGTIMLRVMWNKDRFRREYVENLEAFDAAVRRPIDFDQSIGAAIVESFELTGRATMASSYPAFMLFYAAMFRVKGLTKGSAEFNALGDALLSGYEDDLVVKMGHKLFDLSHLLPSERFDDLDALARDLENRELPGAFLALWDEFLHDYGHRGPLEMDIEKPRYGDEPLLALHQVASIARSGGAFDPRAMQRKKVSERQAAYERLMVLLPRRKARRLARAYADLVEWHGAREYFKHHSTQVYHRIRGLIRHRAEAFVAAGRLDKADDVFLLTFADIDRAHQDTTVDLRALVELQGADYRRQCAQVKHFPFAFDSRGRVFRPQVYETDLAAGEFAGAPVSSGIARGPVKVLNDPFEKDLEPGDVLVAVTTDPGWTPLFINAAAVVLELGGELQHGALVAREYGKPCVSGIQDAVTRLQDGQLVEVNGDTGRVRLLDVDELA